MAVRGENQKRQGDSQVVVTGKLDLGSIWEGKEFRVCFVWEGKRFRVFYGREKQNVMAEKEEDDERWRRRKKGVKEET